MFRNLLFVLVACPIFFVACGGANSTPLPAVQAKIIVRDNAFEPNLLTGKVNQPLELTVENQGTKPHSFVIDELKLNTGPIEPGKQATLTVLGNKIRTYTNGGAYIFYSDVAGDNAAGLTGNLSINP